MYGKDCRGARAAGALAAIMSEDEGDGPRTGPCLRRRSAMRTILLALAVLGVATFVAIGSYSALAGSDPVSDLTGAVIGQDAPDGEEGDAVAADTEVDDQADGGG